MKSISILVITLLILIPKSGVCQESYPSDRNLKNLTAFAKLYGYTKYFHPSDVGRQINWNQFAILGIENVLSADNDEELIHILESLFLPIAPTLKINEIKPDSAKFKQEYLNLIGRDTTGLKKVAWQHQGVDMSFTQGGPYQSIRTNKKDRAVNSNFHLFQRFDADKYRNQTVQLRSMIIAKTEAQEGAAELVISMDDESGSLLSREVHTIPANSIEEWKLSKAETYIPEDAERISAGIRLRGEGQLWIDDVQFLVQGSGTEESQIRNGLFEEESYGRPIGWRSTLTGDYDFRIDQQHAFAGENSFYIADREPELPDQLFDQIPEVGEVLLKEIVKGIWVQVPLLLYSDNESTLPESKENTFNELSQNLNQIDLNRASGNNRMVRLANIVISWNELQHFFPYFDVIETDWNEQLSKSLISAYNDKSAEDFYFTLSKMIAALEDGHGRVLFPPMESQVGLPFIVDWINNQIVVTHSEHERVKPGDIIQSVDNVPAVELVRLKQKHLSGSQHYTLFQALRQFAVGDEGTDVEITVERGGETNVVHVSRTGSVDYTRLEKGDRSMIGPIRDNVFYVDLDEASIDTIMSNIEEISSAEAVIFDLRGYPAGNHGVIRHLLSQPDTSDSWIRTSQIIYPDQKNIVDFIEEGWTMSEAKPKIEGNVVFITDARAISYAESFMSFIEYYQLGEIVGKSTAGTNGSVNSFSMPGSYQVTWTGMKVLKHDGSQLYKIGIQPTVQLEKTIEGVKQGRDEFLERAIHVANGN